MLNEYDTYYYNSTLHSILYNFYMEHDCVGQEMKPALVFKGTLVLVFWAVSMEKHEIGLVQSFHFSRDCDAMSAPHQ